MIDRSKRTALSLGVLGLGGAALLAAGCGDRPEVQRSVAQVQRAVGEGAQGALAERPTARGRLPNVIEESANLVQNAPGLTGAIPAIARPSADLPVSALPQVHPDGDSVGFDGDRNHLDIAMARGGDRLGVAWHDSAEGMWFSSTDLQGHGVGSPVQIRALVSDEEGFSAPAVVAAGDAFGVAWVDAENGRVRFQLVGADGVPRGASIIHDGLTDPQSARLVFNGREFGVAAQLREGVYFARVDTQGRRLDAGQLFAEGEPIDGVDTVRWDGRAWSVAFSVSRDGAIERREQRVTSARSVASLHSHRRPVRGFM